MNDTKKATVLQAVKAIAVLVIICLVCGGVLALCNDLFYISDEERARREELKINKNLVEVYPNFVQDTSFDGKLDKNFTVHDTYGSVSKVVKSTDGTYIIAAGGNGGYGGKPVQVLVAVDKTAKIVAWKISDVGGETQIDSAFIKNSASWYIGQEISTDIPREKIANSTMSSTAINNAIKMASYYAMNVLHLGSNPEADAKAALMELLGDEYADYVFTTSLDSEYLAACAVGDNVLSYYFEGKKEGSESLVAYVFNVETEPLVVVLRDGLTHDQRLLEMAVVAKTEGIAAEILTSVQNRSYTEFLMQKLYEGFQYNGGAVNAEFAENAKYGKVNAVYNSKDGAIVIESTGIGGYQDGDVTIRIAIKDGKIVAWEIVSANNQSFLNKVTDKWDEVKTWFVGDEVTDLQTTVTPGTDAGMGTGATFTENAIKNAVNMACEYVQNITSGGNN